MAVIDTGIGLQDIAQPLERVGQTAIDAAGFQFHERLTVARQIEQRGFRCTDVRDIILTHGDSDHVGGLADFPEATVHLAAEEHEQIRGGHGRYSPSQFAHRPNWATYAASDERWFGLEARAVSVLGEKEVKLIPLFGHTRGHCGVAVPVGERWLLHVGDAYYLRAELTTDDHPVSALAAMRAEDDQQRRASLAALRRLHRDHRSVIDLFGYHDFSEFPADIAIER